MEAIFHLYKAEDDILIMPSSMDQEMKMTDLSTTPWLVSSGGSK